jgi:hypothetical protein
MELEISGNEVAIKMDTDYPRTGNVNISVEAPQTDFTLYVRVPSFAGNFMVLVNGETVSYKLSKGYACIHRTWGTDLVSISFSILPKFVFANPLVRANSGKVALIRGPEVYCLEEIDNFANLSAVFVDTDTALTEEWDENLLGGTMKVMFQGQHLVALDTIDTYSGQKPQLNKKPLTAIPYGSWGNRQPGEMICWLHGMII